MGIAGAVAAIGTAVSYAGAAATVASTINNLANGGGSGGGSAAPGGMPQTSSNFDAMDQSLRFNQDTQSPIAQGATQTATDGIDRSGGSPYSYGSKMRMSMVGTATDPSALLASWQRSIG